jgi:hypothetical protein
MSDNPIAEQQTGNESSRNSNDWQARGLRPHRNGEAINGRQTPSWAWQLVAVAGSAVDQPAALEARIELAQVKRQLASSDWQLMSLVAMGVDYQTIAANIGQTADGLRVRAMRIRQSLAGLAA